MTLVSSKSKAYKSMNKEKRSCENETHQRQRRKEKIEVGAQIGRFYEARE